MDDILRGINRYRIQTKLTKINIDFILLWNLSIEEEVDGSIPFSEMKIMRAKGNLSSITENGLTISTNQLQNVIVVSGLVQRIHRTCSD
jgi:hypothetical protein